MRVYDDTDSTQVHVGNLIKALSEQDSGLDPCAVLTPAPGHNRRCIQQDALPTLQLRILALEHVTVVVTDSSALMEFPEFRGSLI